MSATPDFTINKLTIHDGPPNERGTRVLASFDLQIIGMEIGGCLLIQNSTGITRACGPIGRTTKGHKASMIFTDASLSRAVTRRSMQA